MPLADIVVLTWTSAEWFALDRVFLNSSQAGDFTKDFDWRHNWLLYTRGLQGSQPTRSRDRCGERFNS